MVPTSPNMRHMPHGYRKRKIHSNASMSENDFSDDECSPNSGSPSVDEDRRAHHNELERRRRDHIKDHFMALKSSIPLLEGEKSSRALILKRAVDYIKMLQGQVAEYKVEIEDLKRRNETLVQHASVGLKPFIQLQPAQALFSAPATVAIPAQPSTSAAFTVPVSIMPAAAAPVQFAAASTSAPAPVVVAESSTSSAQTTSTVLNSLSNLFLQNPTLLAQLQQQQQQQQQQQNQQQQQQHQQQQQQMHQVQPSQPIPSKPLAEPLTPPSTSSNSPASLYSLPDLVDAQARLLANSLALREKQFAAVAAANF